MFLPSVRSFNIFNILCLFTYLFMLVDYCLFIKYLFLDNNYLNNNNFKIY